MTIPSHSPDDWLSIYRAIGDTAPQGLALIQNGRVLYANPALAELTGHPLDALLAMQAADLAALIHPDDLEEASRRLALDGNAEQAGQVRLKTRLQRPDGSIRWVEMLSSRLPWHGVRQIQCTDLTPQVSAEARMRERMMWMEHIFDAAPIGIGMVRGNELIFANQRLCATLGYRREELVSRPVRVLYPDEEEYRRVGREEIPRVLEFGAASMRTRFQRKNGEVLTVWLHVSLAAPNQPQEGLIFAAQDVSQHMAQRAALLHSQERYRSLFENSPVALWEEDFSEIRQWMDALRTRGIRDLDAWFAAHPEELSACAARVRVLDVNQATLRLYAAPDKQALLEGLPRLFTPASLKAFREELLALWEGVTSYQTEAVTRRIDGREIYHTIQLNILPGYENTWARVVVSMQDLTQTVLSARALEQRNRRLDTLRALDRAILGARTPREVVQRAVEHLYRLLPVVRAGCMEFDWEQGVIRPLVLRTVEGMQFFSGQERPLERFPDLEALRRGQTVVRQHLPEYASPKLAEAGGQSYLKVPIQAGEALYGCLNLLSAQRNAWDTEQQEIAREVADVVAIAWRQAALLEQERAARRQAEILRKAMLTLSSTLDIDTVLGKLLDLLGEIIPYDSASVFLAQEEGYRAVAVRGFSRAEAILGKTFPPEHPLMQRLLQERTPIILADVHAVAEFTHWEESKHVRGWMGAPMLAGGECIGTIHVDNCQPNAYDEADARLMQAFANQAALALENAGLYTRIRQYAATLEQKVNERTAELQARVTEIETLNRALASLLEDIQAINQELGNATRRLQEANTELEAFTYSVSHDLRAPLRAIQGFADILLEDYAAQLDAGGQQYALRIREAARHLDTLIQDLLAYSRLTSAEILLRPIPLEKVIRQVMEQHHRTIKSRRARVEVESPLPTVWGDTSTLIQIFGNLLSNALKFVPRGKRPRIRIRAEEAGGRWKIWVEDNGIGIAPRHQQQIFHIFERLHGEESYPGTGIGLAIVQKGVARLHGEVGVESSEGQGSRFWVLLDAPPNSPALA